MINIIGNDNIQVKALEDNSLEIKDTKTSNAFYIENEKIDDLIEILIKAKELFHIGDKSTKIGMENTLYVHMSKTGNR